MSGRRLAGASCVRTYVVAMIGVMAMALAPGAAMAFSAHASAEQVYVTGLGAHAQMSLLNGAGRKVATKRADSLGGLLFRDVAPGSGYRVRPAGGGAGPDR
jgi:uncharacterized protein